MLLHIDHILLYNYKHYICIYYHIYYNNKNILNSIYKIFEYNIETLSIRLERNKIHLYYYFVPLHNNEA